MESATFHTYTNKHTEQAELCSELSKYISLQLIRYFKNEIYVGWQAEVTFHNQPIFYKYKSRFNFTITGNKVIFDKYILLIQENAWGIMRAEIIDQVDATMRDLLGPLIIKKN